MSNDPSSSMELAQTLTDLLNYDPPTPMQFAQQMEIIAKNSDREMRHSAMDDYMVETLKRLGYAEGVMIFEKTPKWYA